MSYSNSFPTQTPVLNLNFATGSDQFLDSRISFSRADTPPTYAAPSAVHYWSNEKHLSSLNLVTNSENFTVWSESNATASANTTAAPDSTTTADTITGNAGTALKRVQSNSFSADGPTFSFYAKAGTHNYIQIYTNQSSLEYVNFDLTSGSGAVGNSGSLATGAIQSVGSTGWYRCLVKVARNAANFTVAVALVDSTSSAYGAATSSTGTVHLWGAMANDLGDLTNVVAYQSSGSQIHREYSSTLKSVSNAGDPRFEYDPTDGQSEGLLIEAQSSNLFARSSGFDYTAAWTKTNVTATAEAVSPDGTLNAFAIRENTTSGTFKRIHQAATVAAGSVAVSVYAKILGNERRLVIREDSATGDSAVFDLSSGTVAATNVGGAGKIESVGNGWYRCTLITSPSGSPGYQFGFWLATATGTTTESYTGDGYSGVLLFGAMCENASASSSYLESLGSTTTRAADSCSVATSSFYTGGPVSVVSEFDGAGGYYPEVWELRDTVSKAGGVNDYILTVKYSAAADSSTDWRTWINESDNLTQTTLGTSSSATKLGVSVDTNSVASCADGGTIHNATSTVIPDSLDTLYIGRGYATSVSLNGHIKRLSLFNVALSDVELQSLTSS